MQEVGVDRDAHLVGPARASFTPILQQVEAAGSLMEASAVATTLLPEHPVPGASRSTIGQSKPSGFCAYRSSESVSLLCQNYREGRATNGGRLDLGRAPAAWKFRNFSRWCQIVSVNTRPVGVLKIPVSAARFRPCPPAMIGTSWHGSRIPLRGASCLSPTCSRSGSGLRPSKPCGLQPVI